MNGNDVGAYGTRLRALKADLNRLFPKMDSTIQEGVADLVNGVKDKWESPAAVEFFNDGGTFFSSGVKKVLTEIMKNFRHEIRPLFSAINNTFYHRFANQGITDVESIPLNIIKNEAVNVSAIKACRNGVTDDVHMDVGTYTIVQQKLDALKDNLNGELEELVSTFQNNEVLTGVGEWQAIINALQTCKSALTANINKLVSESYNVAQQYETKIQE